jgi:exodeoxyribonuclease-5
VIWNKQQDAALVAISDWLRVNRDKPFFYLAGYAGSGKSTLAVELANAISGPTLYAAFTGKAALVLRKKGCWGASTIHSLIYEPREDDYGDVGFELRPRDELRGASLIVVDECSMVSDEIGRDLLWFGVPILVLGDPAQLPPVNGEGFFTRGEPDVMLTEIHRQAAGNPILALATKARQGQYLPAGTVRNDIGAAAVVKWGAVPNGSKLQAGQIIVGTNATRRKLNSEMRVLLRESGALAQPATGVPEWMPVAGDKVICLRNRKEKALFNGGMWLIVAVHDEPPPGKTGRKRNKLKGILNLRVVSLDEERPPVDVDVPEVFFQGREDELPTKIRQRFEEFTFGAVITCHKAQGSQWDNVLVRDQGFVFKDMMHRWRYTAISRAAEKLIVGT